MTYPIKYVAPGIYRGPRPSQADMRDISARAIRTVLNLEDEWSERSEEAAECFVRGVRVINIPMSEFRRPAVATLKHAATVLADATRHPILVHCLHGQDRTGYVVAAYRMIYEGWPLCAAYKECRENGHKWFWYLGWKKSLKELANVLG